MTRQPAKRLQLSAQRFLGRRMEHALVCGDVAMDDDPMRAQSRALACGMRADRDLVWRVRGAGVVRPQGAPGDALIVMARESGAVYVRIGDAVHPTFNLASARLVARTDAHPVVVGEASIANGEARSASRHSRSSGRDRATAWATRRGRCATAERTVVSVGRRGRHPCASGARSVAASRPVRTTYLLYDGRPGGGRPARTVRSPAR